MSKQRQIPRKEDNRDIFDKALDHPGEIAGLAIGGVLGARYGKRFLFGADDVALRAKLPAYVVGGGLGAQSGSIIGSGIDEIRKGRRRKSKDQRIRK